MAEMVDETMDTLDEDNEELDEEANEEIEKVLFDITNGKLGEMPTKVGTLPVSCLTLLLCMPKVSRYRCLIHDYRVQLSRKKQTRNQKLCGGNWMLC